METRTLQTGPVELTDSALLDVVTGDHPEVLKIPHASGQGHFADLHPGLGPDTASDAQAFNTPGNHH